MYKDIEKEDISDEKRLLVLLLESKNFAIQKGAKDYIIKPFQPSRVLEAVERVLKKKQ